MRLSFLTAQTFVGALTLTAGLTSAPNALASQQLASDMGCYNCHGVPLRADAPSFERISGKWSKHKGDAAEERRHVEKLRQGEFLQHIAAHERLSPESAQQLVHWLTEGAQ